MQYRALLRSQVEIETDRLQTAKADLEKENTSMKGRLRELEAKNNQISGEMLILSNLMQERSSYENTIRQLREGLDKYQEMFNNQGLMASTGGLTQHLQSENMMLHQQNEAFRREILTLKKLVEDLRVDNDRLLHALELSRNPSPIPPNPSTGTQKVDEAIANSDLRVKLSTLQHAMVQNETLSLEFDAEKLAFETTIEYLRKRISELERKNDQLQSQNAIWYQMMTMREKNMEIESKRHANIEKDLREQLETIRSENDRLTSDSYNMKEEISKFNSERAVYEAQLKQMKTLNDYIKEEQTKMLELLAIRRRDHDDLTTQWQETRTENAKLLDENNKLKHENLVMNEKCELLAIENGENAKMKEVYKEQSERVALEATKKNKELVEKINALKDVRMKYEAGLAEAYQVLDKKVIMTTKQQKDQLTSSNLRSPRAIVSTIQMTPDKKKT
jgi:chromosome segregation ATPase